MIWQWLEGTTGMIVSWGLVVMVGLVALGVCWLLGLWSLLEISGRCSDAERREAFTAHEGELDLGSPPSGGSAVTRQEANDAADVKRDAEAIAAAEMFAALEKLCEAAKLYFEGGDEKQEEALHELYFGREQAQAALQTWQDVEVGDAE